MDVGPRPFDDGGELAHLVVEADHPAELVGHRLVARDVRHRPLEGGEEAGDARAHAHGRRSRIGIDIDEAAVDLAEGGAAVDRRDRLVERPVVEHAAVDEARARRVDVGLAVGDKVARDELRALRPLRPLADHEVVHFRDAGGRKGAGEGRGRARREGERRRVRKLEIAFRAAVGAAPVAAHGGDRVVHQFGHARSVERRLEPARAHEQGELVADLQVLDRGEHAARRRAPDERLEDELAPAAGLRCGIEQDRHVRVVEPQVAQLAHRQVVAERARQHGSVDAAGRRAGDDVDHHPHLDPAADLAQQLEIDALGVVLGIGAVEPVEERGAGAGRTVADRMQRRGGAHELEDFLADPMHVDGERNAAEADERDAQLLLAHGTAPGTRRRDGPILR